MESSMSGTKWRQSMQVLKEKQNYLQKQKLTSLLRDQQRTPANPRMPHLLSLSLDFLVPLIQIRKKATRQPVSWKSQTATAFTPQKSLSLGNSELTAHISLCFPASGWNPHSKFIFLLHFIQHTEFFFDNSRVTGPTHAEGSGGPYCSVSSRFILLLLLFQLCCFSFFHFYFLISIMSAWSSECFGVNILRFSYSFIVSIVCAMKKINSVSGPQQTLKTT